MLTILTLKMLLMIVYLAHWDWILTQSRKDIVSNINDSKFMAICPIGRNEIELKNYYKEAIDWKLNRNKIFDIANKNNIKSILISSNQKSKLAQISSYNLTIPNLKEVGKNNIALTTSTTMMLALGDAIALSISEYKNFSKEMFGEFHPGGNIGAKFILDFLLPSNIKQYPNLSFTPNRTVSGPLEYTLVA